MISQTNISFDGMGYMRYDTPDFRIFMSCTMCTVYTFKKHRTLLVHYSPEIHKTFEENFILKATETQYIRKQSPAVFRRVYVSTYTICVTLSKSF